MVEGTEQLAELSVGPGLVIRMVAIADIREQDVNAQVMQARHFQTLTDNVRSRGQIESVPYCHRPNDVGPYILISGHHRVRAARAAGVMVIPVMADLQEMPRSQVVAKQIAHNELHGDADKEILARMIAEIDDAGDLLVTGLDLDMLPLVETETPTLLNPHVDYDWRMVTLMFLPEGLEEFADAIKIIDSHTELLGLAGRDQFDQFSRALTDYGRTFNVRSMATIVALLTDLALREVEAAKPAG